MNSSINSIGRKLAMGDSACLDYLRVVQSCNRHAMCQTYRVHESNSHLPYGSLIDICSGLGGMSLGAPAAKIDTCLFVDKSPVACSTIRANNGNVLQGDILCRQVRIDIHTYCRGFVKIISAGFQCQHYSKPS